MTATKIVTPKAAVKDIEKDASMAKQKDMMAAHYDRLTAAPETGAKVCCTFVPGNLNELIMCFDLLNNLPEVNAIQSGLRRVSGNYVLEAEKIGHSEDVCTYVKSDIGMAAKGNIAPNGSISAASTISARFSAPSAAPRTRSTITGSCARKWRSGSPAGRDR